MVQPTQLMPEPETVRPTRKPHATRAEPTIRSIIETARAAPAPVRGALLLSFATAVLLWASFTPLNYGPFAWVALVPLCMLVRVKRRPRLMYPAIYVGSLACYTAMLQWMRLGDPAMYIAWGALSLYVALYLPLFVFTARVAVHRCKLPLPLAVALCWVGWEYVRAYAMTGFSWYYLGHTQYYWTELIQISDLVGAYGVSFVVALFNGSLAMLISKQWFYRLKLMPPTADVSADDEFLTIARFPRRGLLISLAVFAAVLGYGFARRHQADFQPGPRVALIQGNFVSAVKHNPDSWADIYREHEYLTGQAVQHQPDVIIWPESMFRWPLFSAPKDLTDDQLRVIAPRIPAEQWRDTTVKETLTEMSQKAGAALVIGLECFDANVDSFSRYNSALFVRPDLGVDGRYDKLHRVPFGEYVPLQEQFPWLQRFTPIPAEFSLHAGEEPAVFAYGSWRGAPIICFEDTVPQLVRKIVNETRDQSDEGRPVDFLINLTNDGWFHGSSELDQHLITASFRAVECRTPLVRAVNTGISAVVDGDGVVREPEVFFDHDTHQLSTLHDPQTGRWRKSINAALIDNVPLDNRRSWYVATGDWFAGICCLMTLLFCGVGWKPRRRTRLLSAPDVV